MALGVAIRRFLGPHLARRAGRFYRAIYVDLEKLAIALAAVLPPDAYLLDVGGGDGQPLNHLLALRADIRITTLDPAPIVGEWIESSFEARVKRLPGTSLGEYLSREFADPDAILIADVMHHISPTARHGFLASVGVLLDRVPKLLIIVKDVQPGYWRASLGYWSDRYVTGDRDVTPISMENLTHLFEEALGPLHHKDTGLFKADSPNYAIIFHR